LPPLPVSWGVRAVRIPVYVTDMSVLFYSTYLPNLYSDKTLRYENKANFPMFHRAFFNSIIDKHQHMHFFTFRTVLV